MEPQAFARRCREVSRDLRRLPREVKADLRSNVRDRVAAPMAEDVRAAGSTVWTRRVAGTTRLRAGADPTIVLGGARKVASGGAAGRDLVFGSQWGGGSRVTTVPSRPGQAGHRRRTTRQFIGRRDPFVYPTLARNAARYLDAWADIITETVERVVRRG